MRWIPPALAEEFASQGTDAYRIADGEEARIERFGDGVIISHTAENPPSDLVEELGAWCEKAGVEIERMYARRLVIGPGKDGRSDAVRGTARPLSTKRAFVMRSTSWRGIPADCFLINAPTEDGCVPQTPNTC